MFYTYKNCKILLNNSGILASDAEISLENDTTPVYLSRVRHSFDYAPNNGVGGSLRLYYYLTGQDFLKSFITDETNIISGNFGGLNFKSGYLSNYNFNAAPNAPVKVSAEISFFDELKGIFAPSYEEIVDNKVLNFSDITLSDPTSGSIGSISNITSLNYSFNSDVRPVYFEGATVPREISFGVKTATLDIETDNISGFLSVSGHRAGATIIFNHPEISNLSESITCSGSLYGREIRTSVGENLRSALRIKQNYVTDSPTITSFSPDNGQVGDAISIIGNNLQTASLVFFNDALSVFSVTDNNTISAIVPVDAIDGKITVITNGGTTVSSDSFDVIPSNITISKIYPISGNVGEEIALMGSNFSRITDVYFNSGKSAAFSVSNTGLLIAVVPDQTAWGTISVGSFLKGVTGTSSQSFVPIPKVNGFAPLSGKHQDNILISGQGFSGVTGVTFNDLTGSFTTFLNTGILYTVPSGDTNGLVRVYGRSGVLGLSLFEFSPYVSVTGLTITSGNTGDAIGVRTSSITDSLLFNTGGLFAVSFNGVTGGFTKTNSILLTGNVPSGALTGPVSLVSSDGFTQFPSDFSFSVFNPAPSLTSISPSSGISSGLAILFGSNLFDINSISFSGNNLTRTGTNVTGSDVGDYASFTTPTGLSEGVYNVIVSGLRGAATGLNYFTIIGNPFISGFSPTSGAYGQSISLSGRNLYSVSRLYIGDVEAGIEDGSVSANNNQLSFKVPFNSPTGGNISIDNTVSGYTGGLFTLIASPFISGFSPISGAAGDSILISGSNLSNSTNVFIGGVSNDFNFEGQTGIHFTVSEDASTDLIYLKTRGDDVASDTEFIVTQPAIIISGFAPTLVSLGDTILISGRYLNTTTDIRFSGSGEQISASDFTKINSSGIYVSVPYNAIDGKIILANDYYETQSSDTLSINQGVQLNLIKTTGYFNQDILLSGNYLDGKTFFFAGATGDLVAALQTTITNDTGVLLRIPREIISGPISIKSGADVIGTTNSSFTVFPTISGFTPSQGANGTILTITGINASQIASLVGITGSNTIFDLLDINSISLDDSRITGSTDSTTGYSLISGEVSTLFTGQGKIFLVPFELNGYSEVPDLTIESFYSGIPTILSANQYSSIPSAPTISSFTPARGNSGTLVSVIGDSLLNVTGVHFISGALLGSGIIVSQSNSSLDIYPPTGLGAALSGQIRATSAYGAGTSSNYFKFISAPVVSGFSPTRGIDNSYILITGRNLGDTTGLFFGSFQADFDAYSGSNGIYSLSGLVPTTTGIPQYVKIKAKNEAGESSTGWFLIHGESSLLTYKTPTANLSGVPNNTGVMVFPHGLGDIPDFVDAYLVCQSSESGYVPNNKIMFRDINYYGVSMDSGNVYVSYNWGNPAVISFKSRINGTSGNITNASWKIGALAYFSYYKVPVPSQPTGLTLTTLSESSIRLSWYVDDSYRDGFKINRGINDANYSQIAVINATGTGYTDVGLSENTSYSYKIRAYNETF